MITHPTEDIEEMVVSILEGRARKLIERRKRERVEREEKRIMKQYRDFWARNGGIPKDGWDKALQEETKEQILSEGDDAAPITVADIERMAQGRA